MDKAGFIEFEEKQVESLKDGDRAWKLLTLHLESYAWLDLEVEVEVMEVMEVKALYLGDGDLFDELKEVCHAILCIEPSITSRFAR